MRRTRGVLAVAAVMIAMLLVFAAPAMAKGGNNHTSGNDSHLDRQDVSLDRQIVDDNNFGFEGNRDFAFANDGFFFSPFIFDDDNAFVFDDSEFFDE